MSRQPEPLEHRLHRRNGRPCRQYGPLDQDHGASQLPRGIQFGPPAAAAGVLRDEQGDRVLLHQRQVPFERKGAAIDHNNTLLRRETHPGIDHPQQPPVLPARLQKGGDLLPPDRQKDPLRCFGQCRNCRGNVGHRVPTIARLWLPRGTLQRNEWNSGGSARGNGVAAHLSGKRVGGIDHVGDALFPQVSDQSLHSPKTTDPGGERLGDRLGCTTGIGKDCRHASRCQRTREQARLYGTAQQQDSQHG